MESVSISSRLESRRRKRSFFFGQYADPKDIYVMKGMSRPRKTFVKECENYRLLTVLLQRAVQRKSSISV
jgi:hypothetical protein